MRRALITTAFMLAAIFALAPSALAKPSPDSGPKTEHGVNRDKLVAEAKTVVEERNGITVSKIASCGPTKKHGRQILCNTEDCDYARSEELPDTA